MGTTERRGGYNRRMKDERDCWGRTGQPRNDEVCLGYSGFLWPCELPVFREGGGCLQVLVYGCTTEKMAVRSWRGGAQSDPDGALLITPGSLVFHVSTRLSGQTPPSTTTSSNRNFLMSDQGGLRPTITVIF